MDDYPNLRPKLNKAQRKIDDLVASLEDIIIYAKREPENLGDADAILTDILERAKEALNG